MPPCACTLPCIATSRLYCQLELQAGGQLICLFKAPPCSLSRSALCTICAIYFSEIKRVIIRCLWYVPIDCLLALDLACLKGPVYQKVHSSPPGQGSHPSSDLYTIKFICVECEPLLRELPVCQRPRVVSCLRYNVGTVSRQRPNVNTRQTK